MYLLLFASPMKRPESTFENTRINFSRCIGVREFLKWWYGKRKIMFSRMYITTPEKPRGDKETLH